MQIDHSPTGSHLYGAKFQKLKSQVFHDIQKNDNGRQGRIKTVVVLSLWALSYGFYLIAAARVSQGANFWVMGMAVIPWTLMTIVALFAVMHDGSHNASGWSRPVNQALAKVMSLCGGNSVMWYHQHCVAHHMHTNVVGKDHDINGGGLIRLHPTDPWLNRFRFQHIYAWILYGFSLFHWVIFADFNDLIRDKYRLSHKQKRQAWRELIIFKPLSIAIFFVIPAWTSGSWILALTLYLGQLFVMGVLIAVTFQLAHTSRLELISHEDKIRGSQDWLYRQTSTTTNFATQNRVLIWAVGGLNYQIEHHLFPELKHHLYPQVSEVVKDYCRTHGVPYYEYPNLWQAIRGHYHYLKTLGHPQNV